MSRGSLERQQRLSFLERGCIKCQKSQHSATLPVAGTLTGTYSPTGEGKFFFIMMAAFAELERDMIRERTMAGLAFARAQGRTGGRPTVMNTDTLAAARARAANGESPTQIAKALGVSRASVYRHLPTSKN